MSSKATYQALASSKLAASQATPQEICSHNKSPRLVKLIPLNYRIYEHKKKVISTRHKDFSFPDPRKIEDSTMANRTDAALNIFTITKPNFPIPLQFDS